MAAMVERKPEEERNEDDDLGGSSRSGSGSGSGSRSNKEAEKQRIRKSLLHVTHSPTEEEEGGPGESSEERERRRSSRRATLAATMGESERRFLDAIPPEDDFARHMVFDWTPRFRFSQILPSG
mmetsp:Transcript_27420/g.56127  ORF Transcript_27420/g.56127 Transcript_27420/m.56127 type:complete len:124 (+) Transcript_27420:312-683(+)